MQLIHFVTYCNFTLSDSNIKLNDPAFNRRNHAILCFKRLDNQMLGYVTFEQFRILYPMLQQNELIGYKVSMESALMKLDPQQEQLVRYKNFLNWIELQDASDGSQKSKCLYLHCF